MISISESKATVENPGIRTYRVADCVVFNKTREAFGGLSNMAAGYPLRVNDIRVPTTEALYQACRFPHLPVVQNLIIRQASPMTAKMKSKPHRDQTRVDWDQVRVPIMKWCLKVKLAEHSTTFGDLLLSTFDKPIVELSRKDDFWGAIAQDDGETLVGANVLGRLLMDIRERFKRDPSEFRVVAPLALSDFLLLGEEIQQIDGKIAAKPELLRVARA